MNSQEIASLANEAIKAKPTKKTVTLKKDTVHLDNGMKASDIPVKTPIDAYKATMLMLMKHVADVHEAVLQIVSEKYKIKLDDMMDAVIQHPKWKAVLEQPVIYDLTEEIHSTAVEITAPPAEKKVRAPRKKKTEAPVPVPNALVVPTTKPSPDHFTCPACNLGAGADHRMCIVNKYNYSVKAWETACGLRLPESNAVAEDTGLVVEDTPVVLKKRVTKPKNKVPVVSTEEEVCLD